MTFWGYKESFSWMFACDNNVGEYLYIIFAFSHPIYCISMKKKIFRGGLYLCRVKILLLTYWLKKKKKRLLRIFNENHRPIFIKETFTRLEIRINCLVDKLLRIGKIAKICDINFHERRNFRRLKVNVRFSNHFLVVCLQIREISRIFLIFVTLTIFLF